MKIWEVRNVKCPKKWMRPEIIQQIILYIFAIVILIFFYYYYTVLRSTAFPLSNHEALDHYVHTIKIQIVAP